MRTPRSRRTISQLMLLVLVIACYLGFWAYLRRWEARRVVMYQQRDVTRSIMSEAREDIGGRTVSRFLQEGDRETNTSHWTERLEVWENRGGREMPLIRAIVSGANGRFRGEPIAVETFGSSWDDPWLDRLLRAYRGKGWQYRVVNGPNP